MQYLQNRKQDTTLNGLRTKAKYGHLFSIVQLCIELFEDDPNESYFLAGLLFRRSKSRDKKFLEKFARFLTQDQKVVLDQKIAAWEPDPIPDSVRQSLADLRDRAAEGDAKAQYDYGVELLVPDEYWTGYVITQDIPQAIALWKQSAAQGYSLAQIELGHVYARGWGVNQDKDEALKWYNMAAKAGSSEAQDAIRNLGIFAAD